MNATKEDFSELRQTMVDCQLRTFDITDLAVLERFEEVPREKFLPAKLHIVAYSDRAIELGEENGGRTLLAPMILARMIQEAGIRPTDKILCVGDPTGYAAAILSGLAEHVVSLDSDQQAVERSAEAVAQLGLTNVQTVAGPLEEGVSSAAPFDVVLICGAVQKAPALLQRQLAAGGRLVAIETIGTALSGRAIRIDSSAGGYGKRPLFSAPADILPGFTDDPEFVF